MSGRTGAMLPRFRYLTPLLDTTSPLKHSDEPLNDYRKMASKTGKLSGRFASYDIRAHTASRPTREPNINASLS